MKKLLSLIVMCMLLGVVAPLSSVYADEDSSTDVEDSSVNEDEDSSTDVEDSSVNEDSKDERKEPRMMKPTPVNEQMKDNIKQKHNEAKAKMDEMKMEMKEGIRMNREEAKGNREDFREEHMDDMKEVKAELSEEQKTALEDLRTSFKEEMDTLRETLKDANDDEKDAIHAEMKALAESNYAAVKEILGDSATGRDLIDQRKEVFHENQMLREENRDMRKDYHNVKRATVEKYRMAFVNRLGSQLDRIPTENLEKIATRIDTMIVKYEENSNISDTKKEAMLSALMALKEIIEEKMEGDDVETDVLEVIEGLLE